MKRVQRVSKRRPRAAQPKRQPRHLDRPARDLGRATYLTVRDLMEYLPLPSPGAVHMWARRSSVPKCHVGGTLRFLRRDVDEIVQQGRQQPTV